MSIPLDNQWDYRNLRISNPSPELTVKNQEIFWHGRKVRSFEPDGGRYKVYSGNLVPDTEDESCCTLF